MPAKSLELAGYLGDNDVVIKTNFNQNFVLLIFF